METRKFILLGGDRRSLELSKLLESDGHDVKNLVESYDQAFPFINDYIIIGPLPFSHDNETLDAPYYGTKLPIEEIFEKMHKGQYCIGGKIQDEVLIKAEIYGISLIDYFKREEMQVYNAIPTAEGAIQVAMDILDTTIHDSNVLILGYGRIGKALARTLDGMGANVHVSARKYDDIAWIESLKYKAILHDDFQEIVPEMDLIFNTIPSLVLKAENLKTMNKDSLVIDLASKPGGVDFQAAKDLGI